MIDRGEPGRSACAPRGRVARGGLPRRARRRRAARAGARCVRRSVARSPAASCGACAASPPRRRCRARRRGARRRRRARRARPARARARRRARRARSAIPASSRRRSSLGPLLAAAVAGRGARGLAARRDRRSGSRSRPGRSATRGRRAPRPRARTRRRRSSVVPSLVAVVRRARARACRAARAPVWRSRVATLAAVPAGAVVAEGGARRGARPASARAAPSWPARWVVCGRRRLGRGGARAAGARRRMRFAAQAPGSARDRGSRACRRCSALAGCARGSRRRERRRGARTRVGRLVRGDGRPRMSAPVAAAVLLARRGDVRLATVGAVVFGLAGVGARASRRRAAAGTVPARHDDGVARLGPLPARRRAASSPTAAGSGSAAPRGTVASVARALASSATVAPRCRWRSSRASPLVASGAQPGTLGVVAALVVVGSRRALLAGALVPWRGREPAIS